MQGKPGLFKQNKTFKNDSVWDRAVGNKLVSFVIYDNSINIISILKNPDTPSLSFTQDINTFHLEDCGKHSGVFSDVFHLSPLCMHSPYKM